MLCHQSLPPMYTQNPHNVLPHWCIPFPRPHFFRLCFVMVVFWCRFVEEIVQSNHCHVFRASEITVSCSAERTVSGCLMCYLRCCRAIFPARPRCTYATQTRLFHFGRIWFLLELCLCSGCISVQMLPQADGEQYSRFSSFSKIFSKIFQNVKASFMHHCFVSLTSLVVCGGVWIFFTSARFMH
jgi:hypothetical protein